MKKKITSLIISFVMAFTIIYIPAGVYATEGADGTGTQTETTAAPEAAEPENNNAGTGETAQPEPASDAVTDPAEENAAAAEETTEEPEQEVTYIDGAFAKQSNPLYEEGAEPQIVSGAKAKSLMAAEDMPRSAFLAKNDVIAALRDQMEARNTSIEVYYKTTEVPTLTMVENIQIAAMAHTGVPTEGDYLDWHWSEMYYGYEGYQSGGYYYLALTYNFIYYTTADQEAEVTTLVDNTLDSIITTGMTNHDKISAIYDYICKNVTYDKTSSGKLKHTAYAAIKNKTAVCQGYALLFYRMALEEGIDARVIAGDASPTYNGPKMPAGNSDDHGWNIVKLGKRYYNLDATWDAGKAPNYIWFLKSESTFKAGDGYNGHTRWSAADGYEYNTEAFHNQYPMAATDYVLGDENKHTAVDISGMNARLSYTSTVYNGARKAPTVTIPGLVQGKDFTVTYGSNNLYPGTVTVTITGIGEYGGIIKRTFTIKKANQTIGGKASIKKAYGSKAFSLGASSVGKRTYKSSNKKIVTVSSSGKITIKNTGRATITVTAAATSTHNAAVKKVIVDISPKKVGSVKAKSTKKKKATISWKRDKKATGYQIVYSTDKKFKKGVKTVNIGKNKTVKKTISKLKSKKYYYVKVRAYKKSGSAKIYGSYSSVKKVKVK